MITVIKNGEVYAPEYLGKKDIVITGGKIHGLFSNVKIPSEIGEVNVIDAEGKYVVPGFIDSHVHILGGGGEGGFRTRTPEIQLSQIVKGGITTLVGCLGTDGVCRDMRALIGKARALEEEGVSTYTYTGSYEIPVKTITGSCKSDIMLIDKVIGTGEVAISDHRSSQPDFEEFISVIADSRVGGMLSGKAGIVNIHVGDGKKGIEFLFRMVKETEIPIKQVIPTHMGRNKELFNQGIEFAKMGGIVDFTTSTESKNSKDIRASEALKLMIDSGVSINNIQFSSDAQGSLPKFNDNGELIGLDVGSEESMFLEFRDSVLIQEVKFQDALKVITSNVADHILLNHKGRISPDMDGDIVIMDSELNITEVICKGKLMVSQGELLKKGTFEK